jgi:hypothetical protein
MIPADRGLAAHKDDSYGCCVICREWVPGTDEDMVTVQWPCAVVRIAALRAALDSIPNPTNRDTYEEGWLDALARCRAALAAQEADHD